MGHAFAPALLPIQREREVDARAEVRRLDRHRPFERRARAVEIAGGKQHVPARGPGLGPGVAPSRRLGERRQRLVARALESVECAEVVPELRALGRDLQRFAIGGQRARAVAGSRPCRGVGEQRGERGHRGIGRCGGDRLTTGR
jgi:hypothetical protein